MLRVNRSLQVPQRPAHPQIVLLAVAVTSLLAAGCVTNPSNSPSLHSVVSRTIILHTETLDFKTGDVRTWLSSPHFGNGSDTLWPGTRITIATILQGAVDRPENNTMRSDFRLNETTGRFDAMRLDPVEYAIRSDYRDKWGQGFVIGFELWVRPQGTEEAGINFAESFGVGRLDWYPPDPEIQLQVGWTFDTTNKGFELHQEILNGPDEFRSMGFPVPIRLGKHGTALNVTVG